MSRDASLSREISGVFCTTCQKVCGFENVERRASVMLFTLRCGHSATLQPGAAYGLDVQADAIIIYPNREDLPTRREDV